MTRQFTDSTPLTETANALHRLTTSSRFPSPRREQKGWPPVSPAHESEQTRRRSEAEQAAVDIAAGR